MPRKYMKKNYRKKPRYRKRYNKRKGKYNKMQSVIVRQPGVIVPDRMFTRLNYLITDQSQLATTNNYGYLRYHANGLFDPSPLVFTAPVPGFKPIMELYENFRVRGCMIRVSFCNLEPVLASVVNIWPTDQDQALVANTQQYLQEMNANAYARYRTISPRGGIDRTVLKAYIGFKKLIGTKTVITDEAYTGSASANPTKLFYWNIGSYTMDASNYTTAGVRIEVKLTYYAEFFNRRQLTS